MVEPLRHRQTKGAETDMPGLPPLRHTSTLLDCRPGLSGNIGLTLTRRRRNEVPSGVWLELKVA